LKKLQSAFSAAYIIKTLLIATVFLQVAVHFGIPLMPHFLNDPAWYFMFKEYLFNGVWIQEELYPSFKEPILYYNSLGYPILIYIAQLISNITSLSIAFIILQLQFACYLVSAVFVYSIINERGNVHIAGIFTLLYFWFIPFFNYAHLLMSETMFICCILSVMFTFYRYLTRDKLSYLLLAFFLLGLTFLIRPVAGVMLPLMILGIFIHTKNRKSFWKPMLYSTLFLVFPLMQSGFNKVVFSTYSLREGFAWNLWNRVVSEDGYNPALSNANAAMRLRLNDPDFIPATGHWWDITSQLSNKGLKAKEIQAYCMEVSIDGIKENPSAYIGKSIYRGLWELPTEFHETVCIFPNESDYTLFLNQYNSEHHRPLVKALLEQNIGGNLFNKSAILFYSAWNVFSSYMSSHIPFAILYLTSLLSVLFILFNKGWKNNMSIASIVIIFTMLAMSLAACSFEVLHNRYFLPGIAMEFILIGMGVSIYLNKNKTQAFKN
jgi:4-amino-4-deoxy-L-arabinose transferase-like glycosyltransferase